eukprot:3804330-Rhodomonas_salina.1
MHSAVFLKDGAFVSLGALEFDDSALTYTFWLYASRQNNLAPIFDFGAAPVPGATVQPGDNNHRLQIDGEGRLQFSVWRAQSSVELVDFELFPLNAWVHVAVTLDGSQAGLFRDGRRVASAEVPPNGLETRGSCLIGAANWELDSSWEGAFSDFRMYKRALHAWEVSALKLGNFSDDDSLLSGDGVPACVQYARSCPLLFQFVFQQRVSLRTENVAHCKWRMSRVASRSCACDALRCLVAGAAGSPGGVSGPAKRLRLRVHAPEPHARRTPQQRPSRAPPRQRQRLQHRPRRPPNPVRVLSGCHRPEREHAVRRDHRRVVSDPWHSARN